MNSRSSQIGRIVRVVVIAVISVAVLLGLASVGFASAVPAAPSWRIYSFSEPTHLTMPRDEVQRLTVVGTGGDVVLYGHGHFLEVPFNATAEEMQLSLEAVLGVGNVEVSGGPGDATGSKPYLITYTGQLAGRAIELFAYAGEGLEEAFIQQVTAAEPSGTVAVEAINVGGPTDGSTVTINDTLSAQLIGGEAHGFEQYGRGINYSGAELSCESFGSKYSCVHAGVMETGDSLVLRIPVSAVPDPSPMVLNEGSVSGGGAEFGSSTKGSLQISSTPAAFGLSPGSLVMATSSRQAGAHPDVTVAFQLATSGPEQVAGNLKDVHANMPPGLVGNTVGMPRCPTSKALVEDCPRDTIVGIGVTTYRNLIEEGFRSPELYVAPVFNIEPSPGEPVAFMFAAVAFPVRLDTSVLSDGNYAVRVSANDLSEAAPVISSSVTVWGVPAEHEGPGTIRLNAEARGELAGGLGGPAANVSRVPLLSNPTQCSTPLIGSLEADEWGNRGVFTGESASFGTMTGCGKLAFSGSMSMLPDTLMAGEPAGYYFKLHVPQVNDAEGLSQPNVKKVVTTLPMGTVVSPSSAVGLKACSDEQFYGPVSERGLQQPAEPGNCPRDSQVGTVSIRTPALELPLKGDVYLATPDCELCSPQDAQDGKMIRLFVQAVGEGRSGIVVKIEGHTSLNQQTGQLTATFDNDPQLPFSDFELVLAGGSRATLANSRVCGLESTSLDMMPWSNPFTTDLSATSVFEVNEGCISPQFNPSFVAGMTNIQAGAYSPFTLAFGREDADEFLNGLQMQMPPGLLGSLTGIPLCKEPQASQGSCSEASLIGHTQVLTGPGQTPFLVTGGKVFLTEGYKGAPFGLSIAVPAKAGPYTLTGTTGTGMVVVRAAINIDPHTAALTVTSDPLPTVLDGIPLQLKVVNVTIDRPGFTFNPTSCAKMAITGAMSSMESGGAHVASSFQVTNCAGLGFKPTFKVSTNGHTSRKNGASLEAKVIYPAGAKYANIAKVKVDLPKQLPSRLTTLQKACPAAKFNANPDSCPKDSIVGIARANTPILPVQLTGPAYFVSHGGEEFPNLVIVLQGYGVRVDLIGATFINEKTNVTSSTFNQVPDVPINSFELYLPQGPDSALAANGNLCKSALKMPTAFTAQNGATIHESTAIAVTGCKATASKTRKARRARAARRRGQRYGGKMSALKAKSANGKGR